MIALLEKREPTRKETRSLSAVNSECLSATTRMILCRFRYIKGMDQSVALLAFVVVASWVYLLYLAWRFQEHVRYLEDVESGEFNEGADVPFVSVVIATRDERLSLEKSLPTLLAQRYPNFEIVVVDDSSRDGTERILESLKSAFSDRLKVIRVTELPEGWLGKCFALHCGAKESRGDYLLFTDADVHFGPDVIAKAVAFANRERADLLCVFPLLELHSFGERVFALGFVQLFFAAFRPHRATDPRSPAFVGVGAFNMVKRAIYHRFGGHSLLRLTVVDDVALGKLVKFSGGTIAVLHSRDFLRVRWQKGLWGSICGVEKNAFAGLHYSWLRTIAAVSAAHLVWWGPWWMVNVSSSAFVDAAAIVAVLAQIIYGVGAATNLRLAFWYGLLSPLSITVCSFALLRSAVLTTVRRAVVWRGRSYTINDLKKYDKL